MLLLNLGCGSKTAPHKSVVNIDWSVSLRLKHNGLLRALAPLMLSDERLSRFRELPSNVLVHDLSKGIPFPDGSVDAVYHSHVLEHLDRSAAEVFLHENHRVLKSGGVIRTVVPDFERACRRYLEHLAQCATDEDEVERHEEFIGEVIEQSVRKEASGTSHQPRLRRFVENRLLGDARARGETHQWMYDKVSLRRLLHTVGFQDVSLESYNTSRVPEWGSYRLDVNDSGEEYKEESIYMEAEK